MSIHTKKIDHLNDESNTLDLSPLDILGNRMVESAKVMNRIDERFHIIISKGDVRDKHALRRHRRTHKQSSLEGIVDGVPKQDVIAIDERVQEILAEQNQQKKRKNFLEASVRAHQKETGEIEKDKILVYYDHQRSYRSKAPKFMASAFSAFGCPMLVEPFLNDWGCPWLTCFRDGTVACWEKPINVALEKSLRTTIEEISLIEIDSLPLVGDVEAVFEDELQAKQEAIWESKTAAADANDSAGMNQAEDLALTDAEITPEYVQVACSWSEADMQSTAKQLFSPTISLFVFVLQTSGAAFVSKITLCREKGEERGDSDSDSGDEQPIQRNARAPSKKNTFANTLLGGTNRIDSASSKFARRSSLQIMHEETSSIRAWELQPVETVVEEQALQLDNFEGVPISSIRACAHTNVTYPTGKPRRQILLSGGSIICAFDSDTLHPLWKFNLNKQFHAIVDPITAEQKIIMVEHGEETELEKGSTADEEKEDTEPSGSTVNEDILLSENSSIVALSCNSLGWVTCALDSGHVVKVNIGCDTIEDVKAPILKRADTSTPVTANNNRSKTSTLLLNAEETDWRSTFSLSRTFQTAPGLMETSLTYRESTVGGGISPRHRAAPRKKAKKRMAKLGDSRAGAKKSYADLYNFPEFHISASLLLKTCRHHLGSFIQICDRSENSSSDRIASLHCGTIIPATCRGSANDFVMCALSESGHGRVSRIRFPKDTCVHQAHFRTSYSVGTTFKDGSSLRQHSLVSFACSPDGVLLCGVNAKGDMHVFSTTELTTSHITTVKYKRSDEGKYFVKGISYRIFGDRMGMDKHVVIVTLSDGFAVWDMTDMYGGMVSGFHSDDDEDYSSDDSTVHSSKSRNGSNKLTTKK